MMVLTEVFFYVLGAISLVSAVKLIKMSNKQEKAIQRYEFDNRSSGGVVQFENFEASESHQRKKRKMANIYALGILLLLVSLFLLLIAYLAF